jgi:hypothetical protein
MEGCTSDREVTNMADNTAKARKELDGHRAHIRTHVEKYKKFTVPHEKQTMVQQIQNAQRHIARILEKHPSLNSSSEDTWRP